jgi:hypothetical protein
MSRPGFTPEVKAALRQARILVAAIASFDLRYTTARFWSGLGYLDFMGTRWKGMGEFAGMSEVEEVTELRAAGMEFSLSGLPLATESGRSLVEYVEFHTKTGGEVEAWLGVFNADTLQMIPDAKQIFSGSLDTPVIRIGGSEFSITLGAEGPLAGMNLIPGQRLNDEMQRGLYPGDRGFEFVTAIQKRPDDLQ